MHDKLASEYFSRKYRLGCAQAVTKSFQQNLKISDERINLLAAYNTGQAPNGMCGAIYAALELCTSEEQHNRLLNQFLHKAKHLSCRDIRKNKTISCRQAVELAAKIFATEINS